jgi:hypothetical protein
MYQNFKIKIISLVTAALMLTVGITLADKEGEIEPCLGPSGDMPHELHQLLGDPDHGLPFLRVPLP